MAIKIRLGSLTFEPGYDNLIDLIGKNGFDILPVTFLHTRCTLQLPMHHRDPFDRIMIAQSQTEDLVFITADANIHLYDIN